MSNYKNRFTGNRNNRFFNNKNGVLAQNPNVKPDIVYYRDFTIPNSEDVYLSQRNDNTWGKDFVKNLEDRYGKGIINNLKRFGCSAVALTMVARIMSRNSSITTKNLYDEHVWSIKWDDIHGYVPFAYWRSYSNFRIGRKVEYRWQEAQKIIFDEIYHYNRPVIIWLKDDGYGTHYVVGYGLKKDATRNNLQANQVMVYNPDEGSNSKIKLKTIGTLQEMMDATPFWRKFGSVRSVIPK